MIIAGKSVCVKTLPIDCSIHLAPLHNGMISDDRQMRGLSVHHLPPDTA